MSSVTDWLTSIGTVSAVVVSLGYTVVGKYAEKRRNRRSAIKRTAAFSEALFNEIEKTDPSQTDITALKSYRAFEMYQTVMTIAASDSNKDILLAAQNAQGYLTDYCANRSEPAREDCVALLQQLKTMR